MHFELARFRKAPGRNGLFLIDIERRGGQPFLRCSDRIGISQVPDIVLGIVGGREGFALLRPAHDPDDIHAAVRRALRSCRWILAVDRDKSAIDENNAAAGKLRRRKDPIARPLHIGTQGRAGRVNQRLFAVEKFCRKCDTAKFCVALLQ